MTRMTGGRALVRSVLRHGVDTIFALPGVQMDHFFNALYDEGNAVRVVHVRHEQAAGYMAYGYAHSSGRVGTYAVVPGPGLLNTTAALATAYGCNAPVLCLAGQVPSYALGRGYGMLHEIPDQLAVIRGLTKWAERIDHPTEAPARVREAFRQLRGGRPRPVGLEMSMDVMAQETEVALVEPADGWTAPTPDPERIEEAAALLAKAEQPMIFVGGGVYGAEAELQALAEALQAPVVSHRLGRGALSDHHYLSLSQPAGHRLWARADVVLAVGSRLQHQRMVWGTDAGLKVIRVDVDPIEMKRHGRPAVGILGDAGETLAALKEALPKGTEDRPSREDELVALRARVVAEFEDQLGPQMAYVHALRRALPEDGILVNELTQVGYVAQAMFPVYRPRSLLSSGYQGTLGFGLATALGAKVANPERPVLSINGDGGFMYNVQELATAVKHNIDVVSVVFNDGAFGNVRRMQEEDHDGRVIASELANPDFVRLAESFGVHGRRAESPDALGAAIDEAFAAKGPWLIEVPMGVMANPWPMIMPGKVRPAG
jgi:acetolactate synthase-1/2/3 large subunit